jgi:hypothetical protein
VSQKKLNGLASAHDPGRAEARPSGGTCFRMSGTRQSAWRADRRVTGF